MVSEREIKAMQIRRARRDILEVLKMVAPGHFAFRDLMLTLGVERQLLQRDLSYLIDRGLVKRVHTDLGQDWDERRFCITSRGDDVINALVKDEALGD